MQLLLLFDLGPVVLLASAEVLSSRKPQLEMDPALNRRSLRASSEFVPTFDASRRDLLTPKKSSQQPKEKIRY